MLKPFLYLGDLAGPEGNAYAILGKAQRVAKDNNMDWDAIHADATSGDYEHLLQVMRDNFDAKVMSHVEMSEL